MAKLYGEIAAKALLTLDKSFARANGQPLDASEVYYSKAAAEEYAATAQAYIGQKIVVIEDGVVTHYSVEDTAGTLKELGSKPVADGTTIAIGEDGKITLANITDKEATGTYNAVLVDGELTWVKPSETTVEGLDALIQALTGRVDKLENAVGVASKEAVGEEGTEGYEPAVVATGLHKTVEDEIARAKAAEEALDGRLDTLESKEDKDTTYSVKEGEKVLSLEGTAFGTTLKIQKATHDDKTWVQLLGINDTLVSEFDAAEFVADGFLANAEYDAENKELVFTWNTDAGVSEDRVPVGSLVDTYTNGRGLNLSNNEFSVKVAENDKYLTVDETGIHTKDIDDAIANAIKDLPTEDTNTTYTLGGNGVTVTLTPNEGEAQEFKLDAYTKSETDNKIDEKIASVTGGESAADVKLALESYRDAINTEIWGEDAKGWTVTTEEDGKTKVTYTPQYGNTSRVDTLETKVKALEDIGAQANVIEAVVAKTGAKLTATTEGKTVTIDDTALVNLISAAQAKAEEGVTNAATAQAKANSNASEIEALKGRMTTAEGNINTNASAVAALDTRISANEGTITTIQGNVDKKADKTALDALAETVGTNSGNITALTSRVAANETAIASKADKTALADYYTKSEIGDLGDKTVITLINEAKAAATYDDTEVRGLITANDTAIKANAKAIADEVARADAAEKANKALIDKLTEDIDNVSNIMNFRGVVESADEITDPKSGDVIIIGEQEWVYNGTSWILFGDATGNAAAITALTARVEANETAVNATLPGAIAKALEDANAYTNAEIAKINVGITNVVSSHDALTVSVENGVATIGFADEITLNGGSAN